MHRGSSSRAQIGPVTSSASTLHRSELVDPERPAVEPHALLPVEHRPRRRPFDGERDERARESAAAARPTPLIARSIDPLDDRVEPLQRNVVDVDDRNAVEIFEARAQREELHQVGHDLDVDHLAARALDQVEHLHVLVERQRHIQVIDVLLPDDLGRVGQRAEQRQAAIAEVIAAGAIVDEADDLIAELAVLKDLLGDDAAEVAGAGNQDALQADARLSSAARAPRGRARASRTSARC